MQTPMLIWSGSLTESCSLVWDALVKTFLNLTQVPPTMTDLENPLKKKVPRELPLGYCLRHFECPVLVFTVLVLFEISFIFQHSLFIYSRNYWKSTKIIFFITFSSTSVKLLKKYLELRKCTEDGDRQLLDRNLLMFQCDFLHWKAEQLSL